MVVFKYRCDICGKEFDNKIDTNGNCMLSYPETGDHTYNYDEKYDQICSKCAHDIGRLIRKLKNLETEETIELEDFKDLNDDYVLRKE